MASIERRADRPSLPWRARYRDPAGRQRSRSFARKVDAERFLTEIEAAKLAGRYIDPRLGRTRFAVLAERWYTSTAALNGLGPAG
jgi:hypothetical protein